MKILQISSSDYANGGGGAIAQYRLLEGLRRQGIDCKILSGIKTTNAEFTKSIKRNKYLEARIRSVTSRLGLNDIHCISSFDIAKDPFFLEVDLLNLHIIHSGYFSYLALPKLTQSKPAVLTLHDMWSFTGHCAYSYDCERWKTGCGSCPYPDIYPAIRRDTTEWEWKLKNWAYSRSDLTIVAPSRWLVKKAKESLLSQFTIHHIPYGLDLNVFQPLDPEACRIALGIPPKKKVLMFSSVNLKDPRKGGDLLIQALQKLPESLKKSCVLLILGLASTHIEAEVSIPCLSLGYISSDRIKSAAYSAADLFLFPTRADNLPLVLQESIACGTPIVSFKVGGVPDLVRSKITGYLAEPENIQDFANGIVELLEAKSLRSQMSTRCREIAEKEYALQIQAGRYVKIYEELLK